MVEELPEDEEWINSAVVRRLFGGVSSMSLYRWRDRGFPAPKKWNGRLYWRKSDILNFRATIGPPSKDAEQRTSLTQRKGGK